MMRAEGQHATMSARWADWIHESSTVEKASGSGSLAFCRDVDQYGSVLREAAGSLSKPHHTWQPLSFSAAPTSLLSRIGAFFLVITSLSFRKESSQLHVAQP